MQRWNPDRPNTPLEAGDNNRQGSAVPDRDTGSPQGKELFQVRLPSLDLPRGGGAIRGIDEKFQVNAVSGTSSFSMSLPYSPGRNGSTPGVGLNYNSGNGNSSVGIGWQLDVPSITRRANNYLPEYKDAEESDIFQLAGTEDLVRVLEENGDEWTRFPLPPDAGNTGYTVLPYRPRIDGSYLRIERWVENATGLSHWRILTTDNNCSWYGLTVESRISDPADPTRIFEWRLSQTNDDKGNITLYTYKKEDFAGIPGRLNEKNRIGHCTQSYLKTILYGNIQPYHKGDPLPKEDQFLFKMIFDYGEHDTSDPVPADIDQEKNTWACRKDPFSSYRPGFEVRTYRRCSRALLFHCFPNNELPLNPCLVRSLQLFYDDSLSLLGNGNSINGFSFLVKARSTGYIWDATAGSYTAQSLPDLDFQYQQHEWNTTVQAVGPEDLVNAPSGVDDKKYLWMDLFSEGISGILTEQGDGWYYKYNLGEGHFSRATPVAPKPSFTGLDKRSLSIQELEGDGVKYLVHTDREPKGFFRLDSDDEWENMRPFENFPSVNLGDPNGRFLDLNADGRADLLYTEENLLRWYEGIGEAGFSVSRTVVKEWDEEKGPAILFNDPVQSIFLADMSGDGLTDIVRIRNGEICYWPNLGYGHFGAKVNMDNAPLFDYQDGFNPAFLRLADIDGSGTTDILYMGQDDIRVWMNLNGNEFTAGPQIIGSFPIDNDASIDVLDFMGTGTASIVYSAATPAATTQQPFLYIDLMGGKKPNLLIGYSNNCGGQTTLGYTSSTAYYLADKQAGIPWITKLPFPVHCLSRVTTQDSISGTALTNSYTYRHGYYDYIEKEFRGFARVEQLDTEAFQPFVFNDTKNIVEQDLNQPPVRMVSWYHTGAYLRNRKILHQCEQEYFQNTAFTEYQMPEPILPDSLSPDDIHEAYRACKGMLLRSEVYSGDGSSQQSFPYSARQTNCQVRVLQPHGPNRYASLMVIPVESIDYAYDRAPADPRISHAFVLDTDELGFVKQAATVVYPRLTRPTGDDAIPDIVWNEQSKMYIQCRESLYTGDINQEDAYRLRTVYESKGYEVSGIDQPVSFYFSQSLLAGPITAAAEISYDQDFTSGVQKRLSGHGRYYFSKDDLSGPLPLGTLPTLGILYKKYQLAYTGPLVTKYYGAKVTDTMLSDALYTHLEGDSDWWTQSGTFIYPADPAAGFYLPIGMQDVYGNKSFIQRDTYTLLTETTTDAMSNTVTAVNDYRTLSPAMITDPNLNRTAVRTDALGQPIATAVMGKSGGSDGDTLDDPTTKIEYNILNWQNTGQPNYVHTLAREIHGPSNTKWLESYAYSDGAGHVILAKSQVSPGLARQWNETTQQVEEVQADPRWIGNGRTILNNKGNAVKRYEPYFSTNFNYESEAALLETGVTDVLYYDPLDRIIRTSYPNGTFSNNLFNGWRRKIYDTNDTVKDSSWYAALGSPDPGAAEPVDPDRRAAWLAAHHYNTPGIIHSDSLGRPFYTVADYGMGVTAATYTLTDLAGRYTRSYDQLNRLVATSYTNLLGHAIQGSTAEKGMKWSLTDVIDRVVRLWDNDVYEYRTSFDTLHRPLSTYVKQGGNEIALTHIVYGESFSRADAQTRNLLGKAYQVYDQSGVVTMDTVDFKGNITSTIRQFCKNYKDPANWAFLDALTDIPTIQAAALPYLTKDVFNSSQTIGALSRPLNVTLPDGSVLTPQYDPGSSLASLSANIRGAKDATPFLISQDYNEKGQRKYVTYGNNTIINYSYDPETFRLTNLETRQRLSDPDSAALQNISYYFDPVGNITQIRDDAQQTRFFRNAVVYPENKFQYDALYQLTSATGREHAGIGTDTQPDNTDIPVLSPVPETNNLNAVRIYTENYLYDPCGNILSLQHLATGGTWTRQYRYQYQDNPTDNTNRLRATSLPGDAPGVYSAPYTYNGGADNGLLGNMTSMPHLPAAGSLSWNSFGQLSSVNLGGGGMAYYVYGAGGGRVRKIIERQGGIIQERIYMGNVEIYRERQGDADPYLERYTLYISDNTGRFARVDIKTIDTGNKDPANGIGTPNIAYQYGNHLGSATLETDTGGNIISYEEYHPFGTTSYRVSQSGDLSLKRYRFSGKERDDETGLYYFGARYYAAWLGRWTSSDPIGLADGLNLFRYCSNNPIMYRDPTGTQQTPTHRGKVIHGTTTGKDLTTEQKEAIKKGMYVNGQGQILTKQQVDALIEQRLKAGKNVRVNQVVDNPPPQDDVIDVTVHGEKRSAADQKDADTDGGGGGAKTPKTPPASTASTSPTDTGSGGTTTDKLREAGAGANYGGTEAKINSGVRALDNAKKAEIGAKAAKDVAEAGDSIPQLKAVAEAAVDARNASRAASQTELWPVMRSASKFLDSKFWRWVTNNPKEFEGLLAKRLAQTGGDEAEALRLLARGSGSGRASATAAAKGAGIFGRFLGGVGIGLSAYSLYDDLNTGNYGTVLGDTAGIVSGVFVVAGAATNPIGLAATGISLANIGGDYVDRLVESHGGTRAEGVAAGTATGALVGAAFGAAIGSIVPVIGTAVGAVAGALIGGIAGFIGAYW